MILFRAHFSRVRQTDQSQLQQFRVEGYCKESLSILLSAHSDGDPLIVRCHHGLRRDGASIVHDDHLEAILRELLFYERVEAATQILWPVKGRDDDGEGERLGSLRASG